MSRVISILPQHLLTCEIISCLEFLIPFFVLTRLKCSPCTKGLGQLDSKEVTGRVFAVGRREYEGLDLTWQRKQNKTQ